MRLIKTIMKLIEPEISVTFDSNASTSFACANDTINIGTEFYRNEVEDDLGFTRHLKEVHNCSFADNFSRKFWIILHELGHYNTYYIYTDNDLEDEFFTRSMCAMVSESFAKENITVQDLYFNIPSEWEATEWAINYIKQNPIKAKIFNMIVRFIK